MAVCFDSSEEWRWQPEPGVSSGNRTGNLRMRILERECLNIIVNMEWTEKIICEEFEYGNITENIEREWKCRNRVGIGNLSRNLLTDLCLNWIENTGRGVGMPENEWEYVKRSWSMWTGVGICVLEILTSLRRQSRSRSCRGETVVSGGGNDLCHRAWGTGDFYAPIGLLKKRGSTYSLICMYTNFQMTMCGVV